MSPRKLTEDDKQEILQLYRNSKATTSTLADRYEVSSSTISRFLKNKLSPSEYEELIQQKRLARTPRGEKSVEQSRKIETTTIPSSKKSQSKPQPKKAATSDASQAEETAATASRRYRRRRSLTSSETAATPEFTPEPQLETDRQTEPQLEPKLEPVSVKTERPILKKDRLEIEELEEDDVDAVNVIALEEMLGEEIEDDDDEDEDEEWEGESEGEIAYPRPSTRDFDVKILPLSTASLPRTCYLVIDRAAELIVKPLAEFADLGSIPEAEIREKTLPVFDNHRIAKRFSHRREKVIKVPDGKMLQKTSRYLHAKGITRLLIDGHIYALSGES